jgi:hypothetical protein
MFKRMTITLCIAAAAMLFTAQANAGCGELSGFYGPFDFPQSGAISQLTAKAAQLVKDENGNGNLSIVGMWRFQVISKGNLTRTPPIPDGAAIDSGYSQWHSDGNEFSTSAPHSPASGNICMGVWLNSAPRVYELNHFALSFDPATGNQNATVQIRQTVTLSSGGTIYTGSYIIDVYDLKGVQMDHIVGQVTATRITLDSNVN